MQDIEFMEACDPVNCEWELLLSGTRQPTVFLPYPEHTITMAKSDSAIRLFLASEESRVALECSIRSGQVAAVQLGGDILAIQFIRHDAGFPKYHDFPNRSLWCLPWNVLSRASAHVDFEAPRYASNAFRNWIDILSGGPVKRVYSLSGREHWNLERDGETVRLVRNADGPECLHTHVTFHLSGKRTAYELQRRIGQENSCQHLIAVNEQVRSILMVEGVMEGESRLIVHGLGNLSPAHLNALNPALLQDGPFATSIRQECRQEDIANFRAAGVL